MPEIVGKTNPSRKASTLLTSRFYWARFLLVPTLRTASQILTFLSLPLALGHAQFRQTFTDSERLPVGLDSAVTLYTRPSVTERTAFRLQLSDTTPRRRAHSTPGERFVAAWTAGSVMALAALQLGPDRDQNRIATIGLITGSVAGVFLATKGREGFRPVGVIAGATLGALPLFGEDIDFLSALLSWVASPMLAAYGNEIAF